jgi:hypothetical protein
MQRLTSLRKSSSKGPSGSAVAGKAEQKGGEVSKVAPKEEPKKETKGKNDAEAASVIQKKYRVKLGFGKSSIEEDDAEDPRFKQAEERARIMRMEKELAAAQMQAVTKGRLLRSESLSGAALAPPPKFGPSGATPTSALLPEGAPRSDDPEAAVGFLAAVDSSWKTPEARMRLAKQLSKSSALVLGAAMIGMGLAWVAIALIEGFYYVSLCVAQTPEPHAHQDA